MIAPGSRNAPLIIAFNADEHFHCYSVPDERSAAFTAMGMTLENREPVAVVCTSGSAAMNFFPAVAEAFYQRLPLVLITADRPLELIDQGVGQTVRQEGVFGNHIVFEANLLRDSGDHLTRSYNQRSINEAILASANGPVHINVPFDEPLYEKLEVQDEAIQIIKKLPTVPSLPIVNSFADIWNNSKRILVIAGYSPPNPALVKSMNELDKKSPFLSFTESVSNLPLSNAVGTIDRLINTISDNDKQLLQPDLLVTMGGEIVSKMIKQFIKDYPPKEHWHLSDAGELSDTFQRLSGVIRSDATSFFTSLAKLTEVRDSAYRDLWLTKANDRRRAHHEFMAKVEYSDLAVFDVIINQLPDNTVLHCANSASIRYTQLFDHPPGIWHHTNRGTSGIDGCTSTAVGHAELTDRPVVLISGDVAFLYDTNAFWNDQLPSNLRVIIINNGGGNIFRIIKGPEGESAFERFQETKHSLNLKAVGDLYGIEYVKVDNSRDLKHKLATFLDITGSDAPAILEIKTSGPTNPDVLKQYFQYIANHSKE